MAQTTEHVAGADIGGLRRAGAWLLAASGLWWIAAAALIPADDYFVGESARDEALSIAAHSGMFRAFHVVATAGIASAVVGMALVARWLRTERRSRLAEAAAAAAVCTFVAWTLEVGVRLTDGVSRAREVAAGVGAPESEPAIGSWPLFAIAAVGFFMPMLCGWALARRRLPGRRSSLAAAGFLTLATAASTATLAPSVVYQFGLLPLALSLVLAHRRRSHSAAAPQTAGTVTA